jgi:hypothetical protein
MFLVVVVLLISMILTPLLVNMFQKESRDVVRSGRNRQATNLLDAAFARFEWRLKNDPSFISQFIYGPVPPGYQNDVVYDDIEGGVYKIGVSTAMGLNFSLLVSTISAKEGKNQVVKKLIATYKCPRILTGAQQLDWGSISAPAVLHWGPWVNSHFFDHVNSYGLRNPFINVGYPRKISAGEIPEFDTDPAPPNSGPDWMTYQDLYYGTSNHTTVDFAYYQLKAHSSAVPQESAGGVPIRMYERDHYNESGSVLHLPADGPAAVSSPSGSGFFPGLPNSWIYGSADIKFPPNYQFSSSTSVIFLAAHETEQGIGSIMFSPGTFIDVEALVAPYVYLEGSGTGVVGGTIPINANLEYASAAGNAVWTAGGAASMASVFASPGRCCYTINNVNIRGIIIGDVFQGTPSNNQKGTIVGAVLGQAGAATGVLDVYFQEDMASRVRLRLLTERTSLTYGDSSSW